MENFDEDSPEYRIWAVKTALTSELDLSGYNLSEIPEAVFDLPPLKTLIIENRRPHPIPSLVSDRVFFKEEVLNAPDISEKLKRTLVAHWRKFYAPSEAKILVLPEAVGNLENLEVLNLSGQGLTHLPDSITRLPRLRKLHLSGNQLRELPRDFARIRTLEGLDVRGNSDLAWPPEGLEQMPLFRDFEALREQARSEKERAVAGQVYEKAALARREELSWGIHQ